MQLIRPKSLVFSLVHPVDCICTILSISNYGMAYISQVSSYLMGTPCNQFNFQLADIILGFIGKYFIPCYNFLVSGFLFFTYKNYAFFFRLFEDRLSTLPDFFPASLLQDINSIFLFHLS